MAGKTVYTGHDRTLCLVTIAGATAKVIIK